MAAPVLPGVAVEVRAADAGGDDLDDHLARSRLRFGPFLHRDVVRTTQHQRLHVTSSFLSPSVSGVGRPFPAAWLLRTERMVPLRDRMTIDSVWAPVGE